MSLRKDHLGGLDGIRALAVLSVVAYHLNFSWARGGFLGVDVFFVLSGFLITTLLLEERLESGRVSLVAFWQRRARRLLPALFVMVAVVCLFVLIVGRYINPSDVATYDLGNLRDSAIATLLYVANWHSILADTSYFARFSSPSPLIHTWSLAIEEQFYLIWPLLTLILIRGGVAAHRRRGALVAGTLALTSTLLMALLYNPSSTTAINRVYYGTDTRLFDLAVGATAAWLFVDRPVKEEHRRMLGFAGFGALILLLVAMGVSGTAEGLPRSYMFYGGFLVVSVLTATVIVSVRDVQGLLQRGFAMRPLRAIGRVSYGLYLWHWPIIILVNTQLTSFSGKKLLLTRVVLMSAMTYVSYRFIEQPIRQRRIKMPQRAFVMSSGAVLCVATVIVATIPSLSLADTPSVVLARYAPTVPAQGSGDIVGLNSFHPPLLDAQGQPEKVRVVVYGDSVPYLSGPGIMASLRNLPGVQAKDCAFPGLGIKISNYKHILDLCALRFTPDVLIVMTEWDNPYAAAHPAKYLNDLQNFVNWSMHLGVRLVVFEVHPKQAIAQYAPLNATNKTFIKTALHDWSIWNQLALKVTHNNPGHVLLFHADRSLYRHGQYAWWLPPPRDPTAPIATWARIRAEDGTHLCPAGTEIFGAALAQDLATTLDITVPHRKWWLDGWQNIHTKFYQHIDQLCPPDNPTSP